MNDSLEARLEVLGLALPAVEGGSAATAPPTPP